MGVYLFWKILIYPTLYVVLNILKFIQKFIPKKLERISKKENDEIEIWRH